MAKPTFNQYLNYLKARPRTYEWGALLVYDRLKANMLLAQEYIGRFKDDAWIRPINVRAETESGSWTDITHLSSGSPLLSFVNANIGSSAARLSIPMLGGKIKTLRQKPGSSQVELVGLSALDPLTAPLLTMEIHLNAGRNGEISDEGRVTLDLKDGSAYTFIVSPWKDLNDKIGQAIRGEFEKLPDEQRVWELNVLKPVEGELRPSSFAVRTHSLAKAGTTVFSTDPSELEEGAILVGVAFNGAKGGTFPTADQDMPYLLPEPRSVNDEAYSANLIIQQESWVKNLLVKAIKSIPDFAQLDPEFDVENGYTVTVRFGHLRHDFSGQHHDFKDAIGNDVWMKSEATSLMSNANVSHASFRLVDGQVVFEWHCALRVTVIQLINSFGGSTFRAERTYQQHYTFKKTYSLELDPAGKVVLDPGVVDVEKDLHNPDATSWAPYIERMYYEHVEPVHFYSLLMKFDMFTDAIKQAGPSLDVLRLNGLLFRSDTVVSPNSVHAPGDLSLLGTLSPRLTAFAIEPLNPILSASKGQAFQLNPTPAGDVTWTVEHLPGGEGEKGSIQNGYYTPPTSAQISGTSLRVLIRAAMAGGKSSLNLVTVVPQSVAVFPFLQTVNFAIDANNPPRHMLVGGSVDAGLAWTMSPGSKGTIRLAEPTGRDSDLTIPVGMDVRIYEAPVRTPGAPGSAEMLIQLDHVEVAAHGASQGIDILVPWHSTTATIKVARQDAGLALTLWVTSWTGEEVQVPTQNVQWFTIVGEKHVDPATGIYPDGDSSDYIVLAGFDRATATTLVWSYVSLPLPYDLDYQGLLDHVQSNSTARY